MDITIIFPHQLFKDHPALQKDRPVILIEEWLFFNQYNFHQQKLVLHRASMQFYKDYLVEQGFTVTYINATEEQADIRQLIKQLVNKKVKQIFIAEVVDNWLSKRIGTAAKKYAITVHEVASPNFLNTTVSLKSFFYKKKTYFQTDFYTQQRKERNILMDDKGQPVGGKFSFDADNRAKFPKNALAPSYSFPADNKYTKEARAYVQKHFSKNYGTTEPPFTTNTLAQHFYPVTFKDAELWLQQFLEKRFAEFGIYEDAMVTKEPILHHSVLSPLLNIGLLNPQLIIDKALEYAAAHPIPLNSLEGFIRQIIGWREFIKIVYEREGSFQRTRNYWGFSRKIPASFWKGTTGIVPVDDAIQKLLKSGYNHHIERLMILGNFMQLCEFNPDEVYRWFMEMYIDAYDWVMVPNVYGMTQFSDGGLMTTKPYISGSNYIMKMSNYPKGNWQQIWDALFWRYMHVHRDFFLKNPRLGMLVNTFDKMPEAKRQMHLTTANEYLATLHQ